MTAPSSDSENGKGCVLIICNPIDEKGSHKTYGDKMEDLWKKKLGCTLFGAKVHFDISGAELIKILKELRSADGSKFDYLVIVIISQGGLVEFGPDETYRPCVAGNDNCWVSEETIFSFYYNNNRTWQGKSKLFILGYGRFDKVVEPDANMLSPANADERANSAHGRCYPTISDFALVYGLSSYFISEICHVFSEHSKRSSVLAMLTMVNKRTRKIETKQRGESAFQSSLTRCFCLDPALQQDMDSHDEDVPEREPRKGRVLLLSNCLEEKTTFHMHDIDMMKKLWEETLKCDVQSYIDKTAGEMTTHLTDFSTVDAGGYDYAVIFISCHGGVIKTEIPKYEISKECVQRAFAVGINNERVDERDILSLFNRPDSTWRDKVKIFILDYCRGKREDPGVEKKPRVPAKDVQYRTDGTPSIPQDVKFSFDEKLLPPDITTMVDNSFVVYATHATFVAFANHLPSAIENTFSKYWKSKSILEMLTLVNKEMKEYKIKDNAHSLAMSTFTATVTEPFYLYRDQDKKNADNNPVDKKPADNNPVDKKPADKNPSLRGQKPHHTQTKNPVHKNLTLYGQKPSGQKSNSIRTNTNSDENPAAVGQKP